VQEGHCALGLDDATSRSLKLMSQRISFRISITIFEIVAVWKGQVFVFNVEVTHLSWETKESRVTIPLLLIYELGTFSVE
jgi:hypothetical protein